MTRGTQHDPLMRRHTGTISGLAISGLSIIFIGCVGPALACGTVSTFALQYDEAEELQDAQQKLRCRVATIGALMCVIGAKNDPLTRKVLDHAHKSADAELRCAADAAEGYFRRLNDPRKSDPATFSDKQSRLEMCLKGGFFGPGEAVRKCLATQN